LYTSAFFSTGPLGIIVYRSFSKQQQNFVNILGDKWYFWNCDARKLHRHDELCYVPNYTMI